MKKNQILLDNALESWSIAVKYCKDIQNGLATLHYQKTFVSSLHNAIELLLKQIMIDNNDHSVISDVAVKTEDEAKIQLDFYKSDNLNEFFINLTNEQRKNFHSIEFSRLIERKNSLLKSYFSGFNDTEQEAKKGELKKALELINTLRNNETHFYISKIEYLSYNDFIVLHNLMLIIYDIMEEYNLLPFWGEAWGEYKHLEFKAQKIDSSFSYYDALCSSPIAKSVKETLSENDLFSYVDGPFELAEEYFNYLTEKNEQSNYTFNEVLAIITMMTQYKLINLTPVILPDTIDENLADFEKEMLTSARSISFGF